MGRAAGGARRFKRRLKAARWNDLVKAVPLLAVLVTAIFGLVQYRATREEEFRKTFWEAQRRVYDEALSAVAAIAAAKNLATTKAQQATFWSLYWGRMAGVEDWAVERAMIGFGEMLRDKDCDPKCFETPAGEHHTRLQGAALDVAHCVRSSLARTWAPVDLGFEDECPYAYPLKQPAPWWRRLWRAIRRNVTQTGLPRPAHGSAAFATREGIEAGFPDG